MKKLTRWYISPRFEKKILDSAETLFQGRYSNLAATAKGMSQKLTSNVFLAVGLDRLAHFRWTCMESGIGFGSLEVMTVFTSHPRIIAVALHMDVTNAYFFSCFPAMQGPKCSGFNARGSRIVGCDWGTCVSITFTAVMMSME